MPSPPFLAPRPSRIDTAFCMSYFQPLAATPLVSKNFFSPPSGMIRLELTGTE